MTDNRMFLAAIIAFKDMDVLDFAAPYEVLSQARRAEDEPRRKMTRPPFSILAVSETMEPVRALPGLKFMPDATLADCPPADVIIVPGGLGSRAQMGNSTLLDWIRERSQTAAITASVCTGSLILAAAGLLDGLAATTHHGALDELAQAAPSARVEPSARIVDQGRIITGGGVTSGLDVGLAVLARLLGPEAARNTAAWIEYAPGIDLS